MVRRLLAENIEIRDLYGCFQRALYQVGELWGQSQISVATEHLATSITGSMLTLVYPKLFISPRNGRRAVVACVGSEFHEIGAKMVADTLELLGWDAYFLGANTPVDGLLALLGEKKAELLGLSVSLDSHLDSLCETATRARAAYPNLEILAGGQAIRDAGGGLLSIPNVHCLGSLLDFEAWITRR